LLQQVVGAVRNIRGTMRVPPGRRADLLLKVMSEDVRQVLENTRNDLRELARVDGLQIGVDVSRPPASACAVLADLEVYVPLRGLIDVEVEKQRLDKERDRLEKALVGLEKKLSNEGFLKNAPSAVVEKERERQVEYQKTLDRVNENLALLMS